jgi:hypothetical protein
MQLSIFFISQFLFIALSILLLYSEFQWITILGLIVFRYITAWIIISVSAQRLLEKDLIIWYPILEIVLLFIQIRLFITNLISKPTHWK